MNISIRRRWLSLATSLFAITAVSWIVLLAIREARAHYQIQAEYDRLASRQMPFDNTSMEQQFRARTHTEGALAWAKILRDVEAAPTALTSLPILGDAQLPDVISPDDDWPDEASVAEFLAYMRPAMDGIQAAGAYPRPVWQPIEFDGFQTLLEPVQNARSVSRLLALEAEHAAYHRESDRALQAILSQKYVAEAMDWHIGLVTELTHLALTHSQYDTIQRTLGCKLWDEQQIEVLMAQLNQTDLDFQKRWRDAIAAERGFTLSSIEKGGWSGASGEGANLFEQLLAFPSAKLDYLRVASEWEVLADGGLVQLVAEAKRYDQKLESQIEGLAMLVTPAVGAAAAAMERSELQRRLTLCGLALKKFYLRNEKWPRTLGELVDVGASASDLTLPNGQNFVFKRAFASCELASRELLADETTRELTARENPRYAVTIANR